MSFLRVTGLPKWQAEAEKGQKAGVGTGIERMESEEWIVKSEE